MLIDRGSHAAQFSFDVVYARKGIENRRMER